MSESVGKALGQRIRELREAARLTQADVAQLAMKSVETISNFERGKTVPSVATLVLLAKHLRCSVGDFFSGEKVASCDIDPIGLKMGILDERDRRIIGSLIDVLIAEGRR